MANATGLEEGWLRSVCSKLELASSEINEILEIYAQQKFSPRSLFTKVFEISLSQTD